MGGSVDCGTTGGRNLFISHVWPSIELFNMGSDSLLLLLDVSKTAGLGALQVDACSQI